MKKSERYLSLPGLNLRSWIIRVAPAAVFFALSMLVSFASAAPIQLLNWKPVPDVAGLPEINYTGAALQTDLGAQSNGDGNLPITNQTAGGLQSETPVNAPSPVAFSYSSSVFTGGTGYYDTTLVFNGLAPFGPATQTPLPGGILLDAQVLGTGGFTIFSTGIGPGPIVLLQGTIVNAVITGVDGGAAGAVIDAHGVNYTGGLILGALPAGAVLNGNDLSISMTSVIPGFSINGGTGQLNPFHADATGEFDINVVPEPTSILLSLVGAVGLIGFSRRRFN